MTNRRTYTAEFKRDAVRLAQSTENITSAARDRGNCWHNSVLESFFSSRFRELLDGAPFESRAVARQAIFEYIEMFYNRRRRHSTLGYLTPLEFERQAQVA